MTIDRDYAEKLEMLARLRPIDDVFMYQMFVGNAPLTELLLRCVIGIETLTVRNVDVQFSVDLRSVGARSLRLDVLAQDADGGLYNIEVQRDDKGAIPQRARYHVGALDVGNTKPDSDFKKMPQVFVIFLTEHDYWKEGEAVYLFDRVNVKTGKPLGDGTHIIYLNGQCRTDDLLGDLMHDFLCENPADMRVPLMSQRANYLKNTEGGVKHMCRIMEEYAKKYATKYAKDYAMDIAIGNALTMLKDGMLPHDKIAEYTRLPCEKIADLAKTLS